MALCLACKGSPARVCAEHRTNELETEGDMELDGVRDQVRELETKLTAAEKRAAEAERRCRASNLGRALASEALDEQEKRAVEAERALSTLQAQHEQTQAQAAKLREALASVLRVVDSITTKVVFRQEKASARAALAPEAAAEISPL